MGIRRESQRADDQDAARGRRRGGFCLRGRIHHARRRGQRNGRGALRPASALRREPPERGGRDGLGGRTARRDENGAGADAAGLSLCAADADEGQGLRADDRRGGEAGDADRFRDAEHGFYPRTGARDIHRPGADAAHGQPRRRADAAHRLWGDERRGDGLHHRERREGNRFLRRGGQVRRADRRARGQ